MTLSHSQTTGVYLWSFFNELALWGVRDVVVSPGSRSTGLSMTAFEFARQHPNCLRVFVDVDERGAAFLGLGLAKSSGRPVAVVCTSGTAVANYLPAVVEAETSRVPLLLLTGDRPLRLQQLGAPQTTDQLKVFGDHVRQFRQMPEPAADARAIAFARQAAREAVLAAMGPQGEMPPVRADLLNPDADGTSDATIFNSFPPAASEGDMFPVAAQGCAAAAGPVHLNFPLEEPLKPDFSALGFGVDAVLWQPELAAQARRPVTDLPPIVPVNGQPEFAARDQLRQLLAERRTLVMAGEGCCETLGQAFALTAWAEQWQIPLLADPLSGLRSVDSPAVVDNYDNLFPLDASLEPQLVIRFGRWPVSKAASASMIGWQADRPVQLVVDVAETRDFNSATDFFLGLKPQDFIASFAPNSPTAVQQEFFAQWADANSAQRPVIAEVEGVEGAGIVHEGALVRALMAEVPAHSCLFSANSMAIRCLDTFYTKQGKPVAVLGNRGQNGIDGTVSSAVGAAINYGCATLLTGDLTLQHDLNALALQRELLAMSPAPTLVVVLMNNNGGAIFDMLPQRSDDPYFERLFLTPQDIDFQCAAAAFHVPATRTETLEDFVVAYRNALTTPGISLIEVTTPLRGVTDRYAPYQGK
ncbi:MAG: 2-succinyl-5-enolpyruvyl-6-hydroxy-3-cyclohexene-1-carboxylic-acid synthase [Eggerthellaceae bacterium]|nr:2-succinyl-5-enolpyruvyl-6-hydroxy-3-cyclohexene-1-carboxylic-acid synthase [Eggerthellaceae bacterium]